MKKTIIVAIVGFFILLLAAVATVTVINILDNMITVGCERQRLDTMSQYCYERIIKQD